MITLRDSLQLAYTKIRTRRIRLFIVLFVASLLFSGLVAGSLIVSGALQSFRSFSDEGFSGRYIVAGMYQDSEVYANGMLYNDPAMIARAEALEKDLEARKKVEAKRLGIEYTVDETSRTIASDDSGSKFFNPSTPIGQQVIAEFEEANPLKININRFKQQVSGADAYYKSLRIGNNPPNKAALNIIKDNKEQTDQNSSSFGGYPGLTKGLSGLSSDWTLMDDELLLPFVLKGQNLAIGTDGSIPIVASYSAAQEILKMPALSVNATAKDKKQRLIDVRDRIAGQLFSVCYRNSSSQTELQEAVQQQADIKANEKKKDYKKPDYIMAPNPTPCAAPIVQRDVRTSEEKNLVAKQAEFERTFGRAAPVSQQLTYRIVGLSPDRTIPTGLSVNDILGSVLTSSLGAGWASPMEVYDKVPVTKDVFKPSYVDMYYSPQQAFYAEFSNAEEARNTLKNDTCTLVFQGSTLQPGQISCSRKDRPFMLQTYGSASLAIDEFQAGFRKIQLIAAGIIGVIAAVILMGMIGRIIADARKETAVFRALGASRLAISQIYIVYTVYLGVLTVLISLAIGFAVALVADNKLSPDASITMALLFNASDLSKQFHFYGLDPIDVGIISVAIIGAALLGSLIPIAHNVRRNPIKDMREE